MWVRSAFYYRYGLDHRDCAVIQSSIAVVLLFQNEEKTKLENETLATEITASMTSNKMLKSRFKTIKFCT